MCFAGPDHFPEGSVVEVVYVAVYLSPPEVISQNFFIGINDDSAVKGGYLFHFLLKVVPPVEDIGRGKGRNKAA